MAKGRDSETFGNTPRDLLDSFVGAPAENLKGGEPPKKTRGPKKVTGNTFHSKVSGETGIHRADRANGYFRSGGFVRRAEGGVIKVPPTDREKGISTLKNVMGTKTGDAVSASQQSRAKDISEKVFPQPKAEYEYKRGGRTKK